MIKFSISYKKKRDENVRKASRSSGFRVSLRQNVTGLNYYSFLITEMGKLILAELLLIALIRMYYQSKLGRHVSTAGDNAPPVPYGLFSLTCQRQSWHTWLPKILVLENIKSSNNLNPSISATTAGLPKEILPKTMRDTAAAFLLAAAKCTLQSSRCLAYAPGGLCHQGVISFVTKWVLPVGRTAGRFL